MTSEASDGTPNKFSFYDGKPPSFTGQASGSARKRRTPTSGSRKSRSPSSWSAQVLSSPYSPESNPFGPRPKTLTPAGATRDSRALVPTGYNFMPEEPVDIGLEQIDETWRSAKRIAAEFGALSASLSHQADWCSDDTQVCRKVPRLSPSGKADTGSMDFDDNQENIPANRTLFHGSSPSVSNRPLALGNGSADEYCQTPETGGQPTPRSQDPSPAHMFPVSYNPMDLPRSNSLDSSTSLRSTETAGSDTNSQPNTPTMQSSQSQIYQENPLFDTSAASPEASSSAAKTEDPPLASAEDPTAATEEGTPSPSEGTTEAVREPDFELACPTSGSAIPFASRDLQATNFPHSVVATVTLGSPSKVPTALPSDVIEQALSDIPDVELLDGQDVLSEDDDDCHGPSRLTRSAGKKRLVQLLSDGVSAPAKPSKRRSRVLQLLTLLAQLAIVIGATWAAFANPNMMGSQFHPAKPQGTFSGAAIFPGVRTEVWQLASAQSQALQSWVYGGNPVPAATEKSASAAPSTSGQKAAAERQGVGKTFAAALTRVYKPTPAADADAVPNAATKEVVKPAAKQSESPATAPQKAAMKAPPAAALSKETASAEPTPRAPAGAARKKETRVAENALKTSSVKPFTTQSRQDLADVPPKAKSSALNGAGSEADVTSAKVPQQLGATLERPKLLAAIAAVLLLGLGGILAFFLMRLPGATSEEALQTEDDEASLVGMEEDEDGDIEEELLTPIPEDEPLRASSPAAGEAQSDSEEGEDAESDKSLSAAIRRSIPRSVRKSVPKSIRKALSAATGSKKAPETEDEFGQPEVTSTRKSRAAALKKAAAAPTGRATSTRRAAASPAPSSGSQPVSSTRRTTRRSSRA